MQRAALGNDHPDVAGSASSLGFWLIQEARYEEAERLIEDALAIRRKALGDSHPQVAGTLTVKANLLLATGRYSEARTAAKKARETLVLSLPDNNWRVAAAATVEGSALTRLEAYSEAEPLLLSSIGPLGQAPIPGLKDQNQSRLVDLYTAWGKPKEAQRYQAKNQSKAGQENEKP
jgi:tetratricopeptide (TPR) repeat protein